MDSNEGSWSYRVLKFRTTKGKNVFGYSIHEVFINERDRVSSFNSKPLNLAEVTPIDFMKMLYKLMEATKKPVIEVIDGKMIETPQIIYAEWNDLITGTTASLDSIIK